MIIKNNKLSVFSWLLPLIAVGMLIGLVACPSDSGSSGNGAPSATPLTVSHSLVGDDLTVTVALDDTATLSDSLVVSVVLTPTGGAAMTKMVTLDADTDNGTALFANLAVSAYSLSATATGAQFTYTGGTANGIAIAVLEPLATLGTPSSASIAEAGGTTNVEVSLSRAPTAAVTVLVHITPAPDADSDYAVSPGTGITIGTAAGGVLPVMVALDAANPMRTLTITAAEDTDKIRESLILALQAGIGYTIGTATPRTVAIDDNDLPLASLATPSSTIIVEGATGGSESATIEVSLSSPAPDAALDLQLNISPAPVAGDYTVTGDGITPGTATGGMLPVTVRLDATNTTRTLTITAANDDDDTAEALTLALQPGDDYRLDSGSGAEQSLAINDIPLLSCEFRDTTGNMVITSIAEDTAAAGISIRFVLPATIDPDATFVHTGSSLKIKYNIGGGTPNPIVAADMTFASDFGDAERSLKVNGRGVSALIANDSVVESDETLLVTLQPNDDPADEYAYRLSADPTCTLIIENDDS